MKRRRCISCKKLKPTTSYTDNSTRCIACVNRYARQRAMYALDMPTYKLAHHPAECPQCKEAIEEPPMKTGFKQGDGRWKRMCVPCGYIRYDLEAV